MEVLSRSQLQRILQIDNVRTINAILSSMSTYLNHTRLHENAYYLNKKGRDYLGSDKVVNKTNQLEHKLMRNDLRIYYDYPKDWKNEPELIIKMNGQREKISPDATFTMQGTNIFIEVDNKQSMVNNYKKIDFYARAFPTIAYKSGSEPMLVFYTKTEVRRNKLFEYAESKGVSIGVFTKEDME